MSADVDAATGLVSIYAEPGHTMLSMPGHSYLSLRLGGTIYTNGSPNAIYTALRNGVTRSAGDTVVTTWSFPTFDIIQTVNPVAYSGSGEIVIRAFVRNRSGLPLPAQAQYLLDLRLGDTVTPHVTIPDEYSQGPFAAHAYDSAGVPDFFVASQSLLGTPWHLLGQGVLGDSDLGLLRPTALTVAEWQLLAANPFGAPASLVSDSIRNNAVLLEWQGDTIPSQGSPTPVFRELSSFAYGNNANPLGSGNFIEGTSLWREPIRKLGALDNGYSTVTGIIWNSPLNDSIFKITAVLNTSGNVTIVEPTDTTNGGHQEIHSPSPVDLPPGGVSIVRWKVHYGPAQRDTIGSFHFYLNYHPATIAGGFGDFPHAVVTRYDGPSDTTGPVLSIVHRYGASDTGCKTRCYDLVIRDTGAGMRSISIVGSANFRINVDSFDNAAIGTTAHGCVVDTLLNGRMSFLMLDGAGNESFSYLDYCTTEDTLAPRLTITKDSLDASLRNILVEEGRPWDRGLSAIEFSEMSHVTLIGMPQVDSLQGKSRASMSVKFLSPGSGFSYFCVQATDRAGNRSEKICVWDTIFDAVPITSPQDHIKLFPNPASYMLHVGLPSVEATADLGLYDMRGVLVRQSRMDRTTGELDIHELPSGIYTLRLRYCDKTFTRKVVVNRSNF